MFKNVSRMYRPTFSGIKLCNFRFACVVQTTTVKVSDERDVDNLTLEIKGRRPSSPAGSVPDHVYRSLGRSAGRGVVAAAQTAEYGIASPRLGSRSGVASPALGARPSAPASMPVAASMDTNSVQRTAWKKMLEEAAERVTDDDERTTAGAVLAETPRNDDQKGCDEHYEDDDEEAGDLSKEECSISSCSDEEFDQRLPAFEGKSFLYP